MAAKEKKSTITKHLKDNQTEKEKPPDTPKAKRGRKSNADNAKSSPDQKTPKSQNRRKRVINPGSEDCRNGGSQKRARRSGADQENEPKTPPGSQKLKKTSLEKELGDLLENATGRNTPSLQRGRKANEKEEEGTEAADPLITKGKPVDDDNVSVRSFSLPRSKKNTEEDDVSSVKSVSIKSKRTGESTEDDAGSVKSLIRSNLVAKSNRKKKSVLAAIAVKKKIFKRRGRPRKVLEDGKGKHFDEKIKVKKIKVMDKSLAEKQKRVIKKPLKFQNKMKDQGRIPKIKNANLKKSKIKLSVKKVKEGGGGGGGGGAADQGNKERLNDPEGGQDTSKKKKPGPKKRKREDEGVSKESPGSDGMEKPGDIYFFPEGEGTTLRGRTKLIKLPREKTKPKKSDDRGKKKRESGIHFEATRSPDDSSVMIVHPRLGPKIRGQRLKPILPKTDDLAKVSKDVVLPTGTVTNFNQISSSYFVQSIPNFNLFAANSTIIRNYNSNTIDIRSNADDAFGPKVPNNEIIVTPSGIVLSGSRLVSPGGQHPVCFNGSGSNFLPEVTNGEVMYAPKEDVENVSDLIYQSSTTVIQPQPTPNTAIFLKRPEAMSTSLISTTSGTFLINSTGNANGGLKVKVCNPSGDTIVSEKALEGDATNRFKITPANSNGIPSIPVAKNVSDLLMLKNKSNVETQVTEELLDKKKTALLSSGKPLALKDSKAVREKLKSSKTERKPRKRSLRNVRYVQGTGSGSELTFSEPETSWCENEDAPLFKTISCERISKPVRVIELKPNVLLELGSEPLTVSDTLAPFETASMLLVTKKEKIEEKLEIDGDSPKVKGAVDVCRFSKENEDALREFGLDSDLEQGKSETDGDSPVKKQPSGTDVTRKAKIKEEVDNILKEMPIRRISNCPRKSEPFKMNAGRMELKSPLIHKNEYLTLSPSKPPTVIDKLLEKNKSLKKAEQEGKFQSTIRDLSDAYGVMDMKPRRNLRETRTRKFTKKMESRRVSHKRLASGGKIYERRGSNPEIYSNDYLAVKNQVPNENVPLRRVTDPGDGKFQRRASIDYDSVQKVLDRRCSLPAPSEQAVDPSKLSKSLDDVNKLKTESIKATMVGSSKPLTSKNREYDVQPRVINIVTGNCGFKQGKSLMDEIEMETESRRKSLMNGDKCYGRRSSIESSNSDSESLQKLVDGISGKGLSNEVPYYGEKSCNEEKMRLSVDEKSPGEKDRKSAVIEESPEDLVTKETILSALGLQSLKAAAQSAQKKRDSQKSQQNNCQTENGGYTGTLKAVIKIQRQEKKGNSKSPIKMVYKASSSSSSVSGQMEDSNNFDEAETTSKEEIEENNLEDNKNGTGKAKSLVIPEKASSFSIHPGRMCSDVCTYCFGKFGLLDTPCHIAQLKDADKRRNILATEVHLTADSCLCDACFRHVDKKSNCPTFTDKKHDCRKRSSRKQTCIVHNCNAESQHSIRRKQYMKLKKSIGRKVVLDAGKLEKLQPGQSLTFCNRHIYWIDYFMSCGICKKRLTSVNMYRVTSEVLELNAALSSDEIPAILTENRFLCKICNCFASIRLKCKNPSEMSSSHRQFYETCRKRACRPETVIRLLSACSSYAPLRHMYGVDAKPELTYAPSEIESVLGNDRCSIYWNCSLPETRVLAATKRDIVLRDGRQKAIYIVEFFCPAETTIVTKDREKRDKYRDLVVHVRQQYPGHEVRLVVLIIGCLGGMQALGFLRELNIIPACRTDAKTILKCHGMDVPDSEPEGESKTDHKRRSKKSSKPTATVTNENSKSDNDMEGSMEEMEKTAETEKELKEVTHMNIPPKANGNLDFGGVSITPAATEVNPTQIHVKLGNLNIGALGNLNIGQDVRHGGARGGDIQCFPTETELALRAHFDLAPSAEDESAKTTRKGFEKCTTTIQFSPETKNLFYNLQMPYGNQSSFFRHLILLEKYFRSGDLVISRNADPKAVSYISSVQNRIRSYEGVHTPPKKSQDIPPSLSILPQPIKTEVRCPPEVKPSIIPSRPFTLTPMPANAAFLKNSPLSQIQATVQNIQPGTPSQGIMTSLLKSSVQTSKFATHPKPEVSITSVTTDGSPPARLGKASVLTSKIQENLRNLASKNQVKNQANQQARAVILNRTVGGQKQSLVQVTTGGKTIHLTLSQFRRIQQMQMRKKQYLEHQAKMLKGKEDQVRNKAKAPEDGLMLKNLSPELEIQEVTQKPNGNEIFPLISEVRSLAGEETAWGKESGDAAAATAAPAPATPSDFPKIPKTLSVSVTKVFPPDYSVKEQSIEPVE